MCLFLIAVSQQEERRMEPLFSETTNSSPIPMGSIIRDDSVAGTVQHVVQLTPYLNSKKLHILIERTSTSQYKETPHPNTKNLHILIERNSTSQFKETPHPNTKNLHISIQRKHRKELSKSKHKGQIKETHTSVHIHVKPLRLTEPSNADCCSEAHLAVLSRDGASSTQRSLLVRTVFTALLLP